MGIIPKVFIVVNVFQKMGVPNVLVVLNRLREMKPEFLFIVSVARQSGLGQIEDDDTVDTNKLAVKKQHQDIARLKDQMQQQVR